jgi:acetyl coenzyme A synthetase (ADP forming)-like protein
LPKKTSLKPFFDPKTVAIIGASREPHKLGNIIFTNFINSGFKGKVYPINPKAEEIAGVKCYPNIEAVPESIDLAVVAVPAEVVPQVMRECVAKDARAAVIISGGFGETGPDGKKREDELRRIIKDSDIRVMGPNCIGIWDGHTKVDTLFFPPDRLNRPREGSISFISQSGASGAAVLDWAAAQGIGMNKFVSYGNMIDVNEIDLLEYLKDDPMTSVIMMYLEQTADGRRLMEVAKRITPKKPIIALKAGSTEAGARAALSHTGALAGSDQVYDAAFKQSGIVRAYSFDELLDRAFALALQPPAKGDRIAIITNGGGLGVMLADDITHQKINVAKFNPETTNALRQKFPARVSIGNPIDLTGDANEDSYETALNLVLADRNVDGAVVIILFQLQTIEEGIVDVIAKANKKYEKPITVCAFGGGFAKKCAKKLQFEKIPCYPTPDRAAEAMMGLVTYGRKQQDNPNPKFLL